MRISSRSVRVRHPQPVDRTGPPRTAAPSPERAAPALQRVCHGGGTGPRTGRRCRSNQVRRRFADRESLSGTRHEPLDWSLPVRKAALADVVTCGVLEAESYTLLLRGAIRLCLPAAEARKIEKTRNRLCRESLLHAKVMARLLLAPQRRLNSPPVSRLAEGHRRTAARKRS